MTENEKKLLEVIKNLEQKVDVLNQAVGHNSLARFEKKPEVGKFFRVGVYRTVDMDVPSVVTHWDTVSNECQFIDKKEFVKQEVKIYYLVKGKTEKGNETFITKEKVLTYREFARLSSVKVELEERVVKKDGSLWFKFKFNNESYEINSFYVNP